MFEGEYANGRRNGKGKEFFMDGMFHRKGDLLFEGDIWMEKDGMEKNIKEVRRLKLEMERGKEENMKIIVIIN